MSLKKLLYMNKKREVTPMFILRKLVKYNTDDSTFECYVI